MKLKLFYFIATAAMMLASCSQESFDSPVQNQGTSHSLYYRSLEEGLKDANTLFNCMEENTRTEPRKIKSVETLNQSTRSSSPESEFYIVNYENDEGFVLLSADKRLEPVFAISEQGSMNLSDTIFNKALAGYIRGIEDLAIDFPGIDQPIDTIFKPKNPVTIIVNPLLARAGNGDFLSFFHQGSPFNKYCFTSTGEQAVVGCAPLAAGTVMAFYEWPEEYDGYTFDWEAMKNDINHDGWPKLFSFIGRPGNMNSNYGVSGTGSSKYYYCNTFANFGYKNMKLTSFSIDGANVELSLGKPLMVRGTDYGVGGHAWVIDSAKIVENTFYVENPKPKTYYYHCVWGWGGKDNGYFIFKTSLSVDKYIFKDLEFISNLYRNI